MTITAAAERHFPRLVRVHGGWVAGCVCGWRLAAVWPRERTARRHAWDHVAEADR